MLSLAGGLASFWVIHVINMVLGILRLLASEGM